MKLPAERTAGELLKSLENKRSGPRNNKDSVSPRGKAIAEAGIEPNRARELVKLAKGYETAAKLDAYLGELDEDQAPTRAGALKRAKGGDVTYKDESYTPELYIEAARKVLGPKMKDIASNLIAQAKTVKASEWWGLKLPIDERREAEEAGISDAAIGLAITKFKGVDGIAAIVDGEVWCNPPYSDPAPFVEFLLRGYMAGRIKAFVLLLNSMPETAYGQALGAVCLSCQHGKTAKTGSSRIAFETRTGERKKGNDRAQVFYYLGSKVATFATVFGELGQIRAPAHMAGLEPVETAWARVGAWLDARAA